MSSIKRRSAWRYRFRNLTRLLCWIASMNSLMNSSLERYITFTFFFLAQTYWPMACIRWVLPKLLEVILNAERERFVLSLYKFDRREPAFKTIGANLWFERG